MKISFCRPGKLLSASPLVLITVLTTFVTAHAADAPAAIATPAPAKPAPVATPTPAPTPRPVPEHIRIFKMGEQVQSTKRGICMNHMSAEDFTAFAPGISWYYNWAVNTKDMPPAGVKMEYIPQVWGHKEEIAGLETYLAAGHKPPFILAVNEPNLKDQAFITPEATAELYKATKAVADKYKIPVVGPNMSLGSPDNGSITAMDPIDKKEVKYQFMVPFLKAFNFYMGDTPVPYTAYHTYGNMGELKWATKELHDQFNKPVFITEFAFWTAPNPKESLKYIVQASDYFERTPWVAGYAFFKERATNNSSNISLLTQNPGELSPLGKAYVALPVHGDDVYYRAPGRLEAESYVDMINSEIEVTDDKQGGNFDMYSTGPAQLYYNIVIDEAGSYTLKFRVSDSGKGIEILKDSKSLGTTPRTEDGWQVVEATVQLPKGPQTLHVATGGQSVNWIEFSKAAEAAPAAAK